jgi:hypothetical protein
MALTKREQEIIDRIIDRQMQLESLIVGRLSPAAGLGLRVMREDPFNSPLIISEEEHRAMSKRSAAAGKKAGTKARRKVSGYQKEFGKQLKILKKKHPRTKIGILMKKAHRATKKVRK